MRICPFWSVASKKVACNNECPMYNFENEGEECIFETYLDNVDFNYNYLIYDSMLDIDEEKFEKIEA